MYSLAGQNALVVGIANAPSIAWGCAQAFGARGADVAITCLNEKAEPHVAPLARDIGATLLAALLSKMADRGRITGGTIDGPRAMDNAVDLGAARTKRLKGEVAGQASILVVPGIDAGNILAKQLAFVSHAEGAGLVPGAKVPVILNTRPDSSMSRLASGAVASLHHARLNGLAAEVA